MSSHVETPASLRSRRWLWVGLIFAIFITFFFGVRVIRRLTHRPTQEPIREWMNIPYVAHSYGMPPRALFDALGLPSSGPPDRRPIKEIAKSLGKSSDEVIAQLQATIAEAHPPRPPAPAQEPTAPETE